jgi:hypothetical protein
VSGSVISERVHRRTGDVHASAHLGKPLRSPVVPGQVSEAQAERQHVPVYQFQHKERKDAIANDFRCRPVSTEAKKLDSLASFGRLFTPIVRQKFLPNMKP